MKKKNKEVMINIRMEKELSESFHMFCKCNGFSLSKRIRILIQNDLKSEENFKRIN